MNWKLFCSLLLLAAITADLPAQTVLQVVTKRIEKTFLFREGYELNIEGEKAEMIIETWDKDEISVVLELTSKHPEKPIAEKDLDAMKYLTERVKKKIYLRNYISEEAGKPQANLSAKYYIQLPESCPVYLKNYFGVAQISNLTSRLKINSEFSKIGLQNLQGFIDVQTKFGDLNGDRLDGTMIVNARRSDINLSNIKGKYDIQSQFGVIKIFADQDLIDLNINAEKSDVYFYNPNPSFFQYALSAQQGEITLPNNLNIELLENQPDLKKVNYVPKQELYPKVAISVTFGDITVEQKKQF